MHRYSRDESRRLIRGKRVVDDKLHVRVQLFDSPFSSNSNRSTSTDSISSSVRHDRQAVRRDIAARVDELMPFFECASSAVEYVDVFRPNSKGKRKESTATATKQRQTKKKKKNSDDDDDDDNDEDDNDDDNDEDD